MSQSKDTTKELKKFSYQSLRKNCRELFEVSESTFDGATSSIEKENLFSPDEMKTIINKWLEGRCK